MPKVSRPQAMISAPMGSPPDASERRRTSWRARGFGHRLQHPQRRRRHEDVAHAVARHQGEGGFGLELGEALRDDGDAEIERRQQHVEDAAGPRPVGGRPEAVARLREQAVRHHHAGQVAEQDALRVEHALGIAGRAGGVHEVGGIVGRGVGRDVARRRFARRVPRILWRRAGRGRRSRRSARASECR